MATVRKCDWGTTCREPAICTVHLATRPGTLRLRFGEDAYCERHLGLALMSVPAHARNGYGWVCRPLKWVNEGKG